MRFNTILSLAFAASLLPAAATATTLSTSSFSGWQASLTGSATELDFSPVSLTSYDTSTGLLLAAIGSPSLTFDFTGPDGGGYVLNGVNYNGFKSLEGGTASGSSITVTMPGSGVNALLFSLGTTGNTPLTISLSDGTTLTEGSGLTGLTISHNVTWATVSTTSGSAPVVDDFWFGNSSLTQDGGGSPSQMSNAPEGATMLLLACGFAALGLIKRPTRRAL